MPFGGELSTFDDYATAEFVKSAHNLYNFRLPVSVVVPVYQEDPTIFARAIESWLQDGVDEVVLVIDVTDTTCQAVAARYPVTVIVTGVPGKRDALKRGWEACSTPLVALVDSDTIWAPDVAAKAAMPFQDPEIGGVATRQSVYNPKGFLQRVNDIYLDLRYFDENAQTFLGRAVSCISARTGIYRRELLLRIGDDFMEESFLDVPCMSGDDKRLTSLLLAGGHRTYMQRSARVWSTFPDNPRTFFKQPPRWARNTWRSDIRAVFIDRWAWRYPFLAYTMLDKMISGFTLLAAPVFMTMGVAQQKWTFVATLATWWWMSRALKVLPHLRRRPASFWLVASCCSLSSWRSSSSPHYQAGTRG